ncbi:MAG: DNA translocase FtsK [Ruminococcaceae bacterium]|nr:DNA translocase FtsK [Oscillospiraceae bacterium]
MKQNPNPQKTPAKRPAKQKAPEAEYTEAPRTGNKTEQLLPIILVILALLFTVSFIFKGVNQSGLFGKIFGSLLYGLFSLPAWLIPALLCYFAAVYRKESQNGTLGVRIAMTVGAYLSFLCIYFYFSVGLSGREFDLSAVKIWQEGQNFHGSGIVGSYLGYFIFRIFGKVGTPIVLFPLFAVLMVFLFGLTPHETYVYCKAKLRDWQAASRRKREAQIKNRQAAALRTAGQKEASGAAPSAPKAHSEKGTMVGFADNDVLNAAENKKKKLQQSNIDIDYFDEDPSSFDDTKEEPMPAPTIRQFGVNAGAAKVSDDMEFVQEEFAFDVDEDEAEVPAVPLSKTKKETASFAGETPEQTEVDLVALLEQSRKDSAGGAFSHPEADGTAAESALPDACEKVPYTYPPESLLKSAPPVANEDISEELNSNAYKLVETLRSFKVRTKVINVSRGPTITRYELAPEEGVRVRAIANLIDDIALNLATTGVRIEAPIPGKAAVGVEVPNKTRETVYLKDLIANDTFRSASAKLTVSVGMDVAGDPVYMDLAKLPHLLIAGTTGSGKSVCMNCLILSLLYKADPNEVKLIMIDPKKVEFSVYNGLPHLITPVVSNAKKAAGALSWAVNEMERRYELIETVGVRDIKSYNNAVKNDPSKKFMPQLVIVIDELADLMMTAPGDVEESICRIAQKGRASGMHLIVGTQRPSVDVITGLIKANIPSRIAFTVSSQMDSRTIIDGAGAEKLIGRGDMLFAPIGLTKPIRVQGAFVSDAEVESIVEYVISHSGETVYDDAVMRGIEKEAELCGTKKKGAVGEESEGGFSGGEGADPMLRAAIELAVESGKISTSLIQRRLSLGYGRAAKLIDQMQEMGIVGAQEGQKPRNVLITASEWAEMVMREKDAQ